MISPLPIVTCTAPVNIAVIKYWGKRDENLNLPLNSSLSACLHQDDLKTTTSVIASTNFETDEIWLNGKKENIETERIQKCLRELRSRATKFVDTKTGKVLISGAEEWSKYKVHIYSENNFPTAAGLASSASGYCCLVYSLAKLFGVEGEISTIARMGSGSACRSMYGGWVKWEMGKLSDGSDSKAIQVKPETYWPEMRILVLVVNDQKKDTSSTDGMQQSANTSKLMQNRVENIVPQRMKEMEMAIEQRNFQLFGDLTMKDSDDFHAVCADTDPPIFYLKPISYQVIQLIKSFNEFNKQIKAAYTFDAGPNPVIYLLKDQIVPLLALIFHYFPPQKISEISFFKNSELLKEIHQYQIPQELSNICQVAADSLKYILYTTVGPGPVMLNDEKSSLIDIHTGLPKQM